MDLLGITSILEIGKELLNRFVPDPAQRASAELELLKAQQAGEFKELDAALQLATAQTSINQVEAANPSLFVSGWRPAVGWIGGIGLAYQWIVVPSVSFAYTLITGHALPVVPPPIDPNLQLLLGSLLGVNIGARSYEKVKGVA